MIVDVLKYFSSESGHLEYAMERLKKLRERHPDREYVLLKNMRSKWNKKYSIVRVERVTVDFPLEQELDLPAPVPRPPQPYYLHKDDALPNTPWGDYWRDQERRKKVIVEAQEPARKLLERKIA